MGVLKTIWTHKASSLKIFIFIMVYIIICLPIYLKHIGKSIKEEWPKHKCNLLYAPFAGYVIEDSTGAGKIKAGIVNVGRCVFVWFKAIFRILMKPFQFVIQMVHKVIAVIKKMIEKFREQLMVIRKMLMHIAFKVLERLQNIGAVFINLFLRLREMMKRGIATFQMMMYLLQTVALTMNSMIDGPIGDMGRLAASFAPEMVAMAVGPAAFGLFPAVFRCTFCFHPSTVIQVGRSSCPISEISLGEEITGRLRFRLPPDVPLYQLDGDCLTGRHPVLYHGKWIPVECHPDATHDSSNACNIEKRKGVREVHCLATQSHRIRTTQHTYLDWEEDSTPLRLLQQKQSLLSHLNRISISSTLSPQSYLAPEGFYMGDSIWDISLEDSGYAGVGEWIAPPGLAWYRIDRNILVTGSTVMLYKKKWLPVHEIGCFPVYHGSDTPSTVQHVVTYSGTFQVGGYTFRDLLESHDSAYHKLWSTFTERELPEVIHSLV